MRLSPRRWDAHSVKTDAGVRPTRPRTPASWPLGLPGALEGEAETNAGLQSDRTAGVVIRGHACVQNLRRGHYELGVHAIDRQLRVGAAFDELAQAI